MSVVTTADEKLEEFREKLAEAHEALLVVIDPKTWGSDEFREDFDNDLHDAETQIRKIRRRLG